MNKIKDYSNYLLAEINYRAMKEDAKKYNNLTKFDDDFIENIKNYHGNNTIVISKNKDDNFDKDDDNSLYQALYFKNEDEFPKDYDEQIIKNLKTYNHLYFYKFELKNIRPLIKDDQLEFGF